MSENNIEIGIGLKDKNIIASLDKILQGLENLKKVKLSNYFDDISSNIKSGAAISNYSIENLLTNLQKVKDLGIITGREIGNIQMGIVSANTRIANSQKLHSAETQNLTQSLNTHIHATGQANNVTLAFTQAIQDAPYGIRGVANNIEFMAQSFSQLRAKAGSLSAAINMVKASLTGMNLAFMGLSVALALWQYFSNKSQKEADNQKEKVDSLTQALQNLIDKYLEFSGLGDETNLQSLLDRQQVLRDEVSKNIEAINKLDLNAQGYYANEEARMIQEAKDKKALNDIIARIRSGELDKVKALEEVEKHTYWFSPDTAEKVKIYFKNIITGVDNIVKNKPKIEALKDIEGLLPQQTEFQKKVDAFKRQTETIKTSINQIKYGEKEVRDINNNTIGAATFNAQSQGDIVIANINSELDIIEGLYEKKEITKSEFEKQRKEYEKLKLDIQATITPKDKAPKKGDTAQEIEKKRIEARDTAQEIEKKRIEALIHAQELQVEIAEQSKDENAILTAKNTLYGIYTSQVKQDLLTQEDFIKFEKDKVKLGGEISEIDSEILSNKKLLMLLEYNGLSAADKIKVITEDNNLTLEKKLELINEIEAKEGEEKDVINEINNLLLDCNLSDKQRIELQKKKIDLEGKLTDATTKTTEEILKQRKEIEKSVKDFTKQEEVDFITRGEQRKEEVRDEQKKIKSDIKANLKLMEENKGLTDEELEHKVEADENYKTFKASSERQIQAIDRETTASKIAMWSDAFGSLSALAKQGSDLQKGFALAQIGTNLAIALSKSPIIAGEGAAGTGVLAPYMYGVYYAQNVLAVLSAIAQAKSALGVEFAKGGYTGDGGRFEEAGVVHKGEVVFEKPLVDKYKNPLLQLRSMMQNGGSYVPYNTSNYDMATQRELKALRSDMGMFMKQDRNVNVSLKGTLKGQKFLKDEMPKHNKFTKNKYV